MIKLSNILITKNKEDSDLNLDQIIERSDLDYSELNFKPSTIDLISSLNSINKKLNTNSNYLRNFKSIIPQINFTPFLKPLYTVVLTSIAIIAFLLLKDTTQSIKFAEISVNCGEKITLHITDEITIWLNSESKIKIPLEFKRNSKIYLDGEAYFEINQDKKITVVAGNIIVESKDCKFNLNSKNKNLIVAQVIDGNLDFYNPELPRSTKLILVANDKAIYNPIANFIAVEKDYNTNYLAWHTGNIEFIDTPLNSATNTLSEHFKIPIKIENTELSKQKITVQFENLEIDDILDIIQSKFNCQISADGSKIVIN